MIWRAALSLALLLAVLVAWLIWRHDGIPVLLLSALCFLYIAAALFDWWVVSRVAELVRLADEREAPGEEPLREQMERFAMVATSATAIAAVGLNYLLGGPRGLGLVLLCFGSLLPSLSLGLWLLRTYYRRF